MRPTGRLHIGHFFGALENWVKLQSDPQYECFFFVADWHALTSDYADTSQVAQNSIEIATDWLASGLDPAKCTMFLQSSVPEHAELQLLLSMVTPLGWLERVPTYKEAIENVQGKDLHTYGFLGYPVLQCADIVIYDADRVPVGEDQVAHVELTREIVRRFNYLYSKERFKVSPKLFLNSGYISNLIQIIYDESSARRRVTEAIGHGDPSEFIAQLNNYVDDLDNWRAFQEELPEIADLITYSPVMWEPEPMLTRTPRIPGTDGRKMSKSYGNFISLSESDESIRTKSRAMITDPARKRRTDPGNPDVCPVYDWHKLFSPPETLAWAADGCRTAGIGCIECKMSMADHLIKWIEPVRARREEYAAHPDKVLRILDEGSGKAREVAQKTMSRVREAMFNWKEKRTEIAAQVTSSENAKAGK
jgi:tryptophanyl-tRNA synthetase